MGPPRFSQFDTVRFVRNTPPRALPTGSIRAHALAGETGVIVEVYCSPCEGYEVEIMDSNGKTLALVSVEPSSIEFVAAKTW